MRLIDKDDLMKALNISYSCSDCEHKNGAFCNKASEFVWACETICDAPTVNQWIPCSERLPEEYNNYLVTFDDEDVGIGTFHAKTTKWSTCDAQGVYTVSNDSIIAWMPLPEPYKEDKA